MTIGIDMDDTIENLLDAWFEWLNKKHGKSVNSSDVIDWDLSVVYPELSKEQLYEPLSSYEFWDSVKPKIDAVKYIKKLIDDKNSVYIITASYYTTITQKMDMCLFKWFPYLTWKNIIITTDKHLVDVDVLIDDYEENLKRSKAKRVLFKSDRIKNLIKTGKEFKCADLITESWREIYKYINNLKELI